jgi:DNA-binding transcriptional MerR regulator
MDDKTKQREYTLQDASDAFGVPITVLRNYIARGILKHVGNVPLAGAKRTFSVSGMVEIGIVAQLSAQEIPLKQAALIASNNIDCKSGRIVVKRPVVIDAKQIHDRISKHLKAAESQS